ncbi:MAG: nitrate reductase molybdenum cofactor assembly chaperone, partial [Aquabacterium sp.]|nr:nitrate reductase molybdenum cofactor assembly chaperone [Aquabacterium sp.]
MSLTLRVLAHLLSYPDAALRGHLDEMRDALRSERALTTGRLLEIDTLIDRLRSPRTLDTEAIYVELFDRGRGTALHLFEHVHGDSRDRGPAMIDLIKTYEQ